MPLAEAPAPAALPAPRQFRSTDALVVGRAAGFLVPPRLAGESGRPSTSSRGGRAGIDIEFGFFTPPRRCAPTLPLRGRDHHDRSVTMRADKRCDALAELFAQMARADFLD